MNISRLKNFIAFLIIATLTLNSFYFGYLYSYFNTDIHHFSHNLEVFLDFKNGYELNKDIFVLYGNGQIYLLDIISNFIDINLVTIGIISQFFFSIKFVLFFYILKYFLDNLTSAIGTFFYYTLYTFTQTASPDIFASFFLHVFLLIYLYNSNSKNIYYIFISSVILFIVFFFRNTYLLNFILFFIILFFLNFFFKKKLEYENKIFIYFFTTIFLYFIILYKNDNLYLWFSQSIGVGFTNFLDLVPSDNFEIFAKIKKLCFYILRILRHIVYPNSYGSSLTFSIIILLNFLFFITFIYQFYLKKNKTFFIRYKLLIIIFLISLCGSIQLLNKFETARYINASFGFIVIFFYFVNYFFLKSNNLIKKTLITISVLLTFIPALLKYPVYSNLFKLHLSFYHPETLFNFQNNHFKIYDHKYFGKKKFNREHIEYYENIQNIICNYDNIYNQSFDRSFHYLCKTKKKYIPSFYYKTLFSNEIKIDEFINFNKKNSVLISDNQIPELKILKKLNLPRFVKFTKTDLFYVYFTDTIYIYEL